MLRRTLGPKVEGVTGIWRKLHDEELHDVYRSSNTIFFSMALPPFQGPRLLFSSVIILQTVGLLERVISPLRGRYLNTGQLKQKKRIHKQNIHALNGIRTHDPRVRGCAIAQAVSRWLPTAAARGSSPGLVMWDLW
jgi:hypothetical protein